jgi:hypothetical protein
VQLGHGASRSLGVVYTPPEVAEPMVRVAIEPMVLGRSIDQILALRICDPAIGEGAFLIAVVRVLADHLVRAGLAPEAAPRAAARCVYGVDVDPRAVETARAALGVDAAQLQVGDALTLDWAAAFPAVFAGHDPAREPVHDPAREPAHDPAREPAHDPAREPVHDPAREPAREPAGDPVREPAREPAGDPVREPVHDPAREPVHDPAREPVHDPAREPAGDPAREPVHDPAREPAGDPVREPVHDPAREPAHDPAREPVHDPVREPVHDPAREPAGDPAREPAHGPGDLAPGEPARGPGDLAPGDPAGQPGDGLDGRPRGAGLRGGFDAVIGNPPYVRQEYLAAHKPALRRFASYDGVADLYVYFVELVHRLARPGGRYCLITPNKWLTAAYGRALRSYLAAQRSVEGVVDLARAAVFEDADAFPCIVWGTIGGARDQPIQAARLSARAALELGAIGVPHARERWRGDPWHIDAPDDRALIDRLDTRWPALGEFVAGRPARGVVTGYNRAFVLDRATRDRLLAAEPAAAALIRPFLRGRDVRTWLPREAERWILLVDRGTSLAELPGVLAHLERFRSALEPRPADWRAPWPGRKAGAYRWYELQDPVGPLIKARAPRLLYQDIQTGPACCLDREGDVVPDTTVWMLPSSDLYLLAVLNAPLYSWYARRRFPPALNGSVRPKLDYIRHLPIAIPPDALRASIEQLAVERIALESAQRAGARDTADAARALDAALTSAIYDAYELSAAERAVISADRR